MFFTDFLFFINQKIVNFLRKKLIRIKKSFKTFS